MLLRFARFLHSAALLLLRFRRLLLCTRLLLLGLARFLAGTRLLFLRLARFLAGTRLRRLCLAGRILRLVGGLLRCLRRLLGVIVRPSTSSAAMSCSTSASPSRNSPCCASRAASSGGGGNELAASLGVTPSTVSRWESGAAPILPTADRALRLMVVATGAVGLFDVGELGKIDDADSAPLEVELVLTEAGWMPSGLANRKAS